jgi:ATP-dependent Lon protease
MFNREKSEVRRVPMMPVREMVIFPEMMHPFIVGTRRTSDFSLLNIEPL